MKVKTSEIIAGLTTTIIFVAVFSIFFDIPKILPDFSDFTSLFESDKSSQKKKSTKPRIKSSGNEGKVIDSFNGVDIYYNGRVANIQGRNVTSDGYNLGLKYQCVEFVKRYYYEFYNHQMPNSYGNAKDFFSYSISDGDMNADRGLRQFKNPSYARPKIGDLLIFGATQWNEFGHVAIISNVKNNSIEIAQQNPGSNNPSRKTYSLNSNDGTYSIGSPYVLGWLRKS
ncbi:MAG: surface antigen [Saprospiraceae bacterium]|jgi:surface antigen|tara:strand:+ start:752 stop:1432 length:681 start_codon:yes stop_codon:yes gene_type:complete